MEHDPRPFVRMFVTRNERGELEPKGSAGLDVVMKTVAEIRGHL